MIKIAYAYHIASGEDWTEGAELTALSDEVIDDRTAVPIRFNYPLTNPVDRIVQGPLTKRSLAEAITVEYDLIYDEEERSRTTDPNPRGPLLNRSATNGVHGIWGHDLADLVLEGAGRDDNGIWHLWLGS